jgi:glycosyltransferase involved in cell wall biosynthesis
MQTVPDKAVRNSPVPVQPPRPITVNGRYRVHKVAGQQRYANELIRRMGDAVRVIEPAKPLRGARGHVWEQFTLPMSAGKDLLWSPCQAGPMFLRNQVVTFHDLFALENPEWFSVGYAWWYRQIIPPLARSAKRLIAVSAYTRRRLVSFLGIPEEKITVIHSGIGENFCSQPPHAIAAMAAKLGLPSLNYVLSVSSLEPRKNLPGILAAWSAAAPRIPGDCWLVLAGGKGSTEVFAKVELDRPAPRVHFTGYVDDALLPALYAGAKAFVYPSLAEGFGFPVLEAMSCGTPSLTANTSSLPEVAGDGALKVNPLSVAEIAEGIVAMVCSPSLRNELRGRGLRQSARFDWDRAAEKTLAVLRAADTGKDNGRDAGREAKAVYA